MEASKIKELKEFVKLVEAQPDLLHTPDLAFFKKYLTSLSATIPGKKEEHGHGHAHKEEHGHQHKPGGGCCEHDHDHGGGGHEHEHGHAHSAPEEPDEPEEADPDLMAPDNDPPQEMGPENPGEPSEADIDKSTELKMAAAEAASNGDHAKAIESFTAALKLMPSPLLYAKRAECFLKLKKPNAAMRDCDKALATNPDSAKALRIRGSAHRFLGNYEAAQTDLAAAQRIDYDDGIDAIQKFVNKRCVDRRAKALKKKQKEDKERKEKAKREYEKAKACAAGFIERAVHPLSEDGAPSATSDRLQGQAAPAPPGAPSEQLRGSPWPQQPASGRPKVVEDGAPRTTSRRRRPRAGHPCPAAACPAWVAAWAGWAGCRGWAAGCPAGCRRAWTR